MQKSNPDFAKALKRYCDAMADGKGHVKALELSRGLNHAQAGLAWYGDPRNPAHVKLDPKFAGMTDARKATFVAELRVGSDENGRALHRTENHVGEALSWGQIMVITGLSEGAVRNLFGQATGIASEGTRSGQGGRHLDGKPELYVGNHKGIGVEDPQPRQVKVDAAYMKAADEVESVLPKRLAAAKSTSAAKAKRAAKKAAPKATNGSTEATA